MRVLRYILTYEDMYVCTCCGPHAGTVHIQQRCTLWSTGTVHVYRIAGNNHYIWRKEP